MSSNNKNKNSNTIGNAKKNGGVNASNSITQLQNNSPNNNIVISNTPNSVNTSGLSNLSSSNIKKNKKRAKWLA